MHSRYIFRSVGINTDPSLREIFDSRGIRSVRQYTSPKFVYPNAEQLADLTTIGHVWSIGDRFYKLAHEHYGSSELWWVIAWYNQTPLESQVAMGDVVEIPFPLVRILRILEV